MDQPNVSRAPREAGDVDAADAHPERSETRRLELREEELVARTERMEAGVVRIRREAERVPAQLDVEVEHDEVHIEREAIGHEVSERREPWDEDGVTVIPIYEEQIVVAKRLVLKEQIRVRPVRQRETRHIEDTVLRERLNIDDAQATGLVREIYPTDREPDKSESDTGNPLERALKKALS